MENLKKLLYYLRCDIIFLLAHIVPKNKNLWIFGAWFGEKYWGNTKYFFEYVNKHHPQIRAVWLTKNKDTLSQLQHKGYEVYDACSLKGILLSMRAYFCIITHNLYDINEYAVGGIKIIQLRRGTPFLKISSGDGAQKPRSKWYNILHFNLPLFSNYVFHLDEKLVISTSDKVSSVYIRFFRVPPENIKITGYPRNDIFFNGYCEQMPVLKKINSIRSNLKIGFFVPHGKFSLFKKDITVINARLKKINTVLFVKPYACSHGKADEYFSEYSNIFFVNDEDINNDFYPLLPLTHLLITDYSSIFFDYVLLNKPIIFSPLEMPASERQFYYGYDRVTPGPKAENWNEVIEYIEEAVINPRKYEKERMVCRDTFNAFCDANSCNRIFRELEKISHRTGLL